MKIAILIDELAPGSAPKLIGQAIRGLNRLGHTCEALILVDNKLADRYPEIYNYHLKGVKIRYLSEEAPRIFKIIDFKFPGFSFFSLHHILSFFIAPLVIKRNEFDIIIAHCQYSAFSAWGLKLFRKIPYLLLVWDPATYTLKKIYTKTWLRYLYHFLYPFASFLDKFSTRGAKALITSGSLHHAEFRKISGKPLEDLFPGCIPSEEFIKYSERVNTILTYDRWDIGNKPQLFLEILNKLEEGIKLKVGGFWHPESIKEDFIKEVELRNLSHRVELLGPLDENDILRLCKETILHLHQNEEAFGMQTLEAAACGCCIIIPKGSGVTDIFQHGIHGYFPDKNNPEELLFYIKAIFSDLNKSEEMGKKAWEAAKKYTWEKHVKRLEEIIYKYIKVK